MSQTVAELVAAVRYLLPRANRHLTTTEELEQVNRALMAAATPDPAAGTGIHARIHSMTVEEFRAMAESMIDDLYGDGETLDPDKEWSGTTFENLAATLDGYDLVPSEPEPNPFYLSNPDAVVDDPSQARQDEDNQTADAAAWEASGYPHY